MNDWIEALKNAALGGKDSAETIMIQEELRKIGHQIDPKDLDFDENAVIGSGTWKRFLEFSDALNFSPHKIKELPVL